ncbi:putative DNA-binding domain-containing protein, partial [Mesorhizobium sp. M2D.F.Ca.ET.185.01.1.1]|uniref:HvfC/BufC family peptide modification chaperone n=1 Tax=Mesorhizobium sp. M2D.F.Ca.ET.185.01.1.1 TaxID=2563938 RepID=UPI001AEDCB58
AVYRRLCIDSLDTLLAGSLPRLRQQLGTPRWRDTVEHYYARHRCAQRGLHPCVATVTTRESSRFYLCGFSPQAAFGRL